MPGLLLFLLVVGVPFAFTNVLMFLRWNITDIYNPGMSFAGLDNFRFVFLEDPNFWDAIIRSLLFSGFVVPVEFLLGFIIALALVRETAFFKVTRSVLLIPLLLAPVIVGSMWRVLYSPTFGPINYVLQLLGIPAQLWLSSPAQSLVSVAIEDIWEWTPFLALISMAGLQALPVEPFESASVDGASYLEVLRHITLPMLRPYLLVGLLIRSMDAMKTYDLVIASTQGGPGFSTILSSIHISRTAFMMWHIGEAAAESYVFFMIVTILTVLLIRSMRMR
jgi:multiple sugar transport system permease protein